MVQWSSCWSLTWARSMLPANALLQSSESLQLHLDKARASRGIPEPGRCWWWYCHGARWSPAQHTNIKDSKQISEPKLVSIEGSFIISYLLCFMAISKSRNLRSDGVVGRMKMEPSRWIGWSHHITSISHSQKRVRGCEGREQHSSHFTHLMIDSSLIACSLSVSFSHLK